MRLAHRLNCRGGSQPALQCAGNLAMLASWQGQFPIVGFLAEPVSYKIQEIKLLSVWLRDVHSTKSLISFSFVRALYWCPFHQELDFFLFRTKTFWCLFHQKLDFFLLCTKKNRQQLRRKSRKRPFYRDLSAVLHLFCKIFLLDGAFWVLPPKVSIGYIQFSL